MMKNYTIIFVGVFWLFQSGHSYALGVAPMQFPLQPYLLEESDLLDFISPFKMTSVSVGVAYPDYSRNASEIFRRTGWFSSSKLPVVAEIKLETPFYKETQAIGFDITCYGRPIYNGLRMYIDPNYVSKEKSCCAMFGALDALLTYKWKWPIYTPIGSFAGAITGKGGLIVPISAIDSDTHSYHGIGLGGVIGGAIGCDYYFNQWFGCFLEFSLKYNGIFLSSGSANKPYGFYTTAFTFGFKTTL